MSTIKLLNGKRKKLPKTCGNQHGLHCPNCGSSRSVNICTEQMAKLTPDGTDEHGDVEWTDNSYASCGEWRCDWTGIVDQLIFVEINDETLEYT